MTSATGMPTEPFIPMPDKSPAASAELGRILIDADTQVSRAEDGSA